MFVEAMIKYVSYIGWWGKEMTRLQKQLDNSLMVAIKWFDRIKISSGAAFTSVFLP